MVSHKSRNGEEALALLDQAKTAALEKLREKLEKTPEKITSAELDRLGRWTKALQKREPDLVRTKAALAEKIPCSRVTLDKYWNTPGHPKKDANGLLSISAWRQFIATVSEIDFSKNPDVGTFESKEETNQEKALKLRKLIADTEKSEADLEKSRHELEASRGRYITKDQAKEDVIKCNEAFKQELTRRFTQVLPAEYEACGGDAEQCRAINREHLLAAFEFLHSGEW